MKERRPKVLVFELSVSAKEQTGLPGRGSVRGVRSEKVREIGRSKLGALLYGILPPTTVTAGYVTGLAGAQMAVRLQQTTQIIPSVHTAYVSTNKAKNRFKREGTFFSFFFLNRGGRASCLRACLDAMSLSQSNY